MKKTWVEAYYIEILFYFYTQMTMEIYNYEIFNL